MKRKVLFLSLLLAIGSMVQAQTVRLSSHSMNTSVQKTIIREYSYPATISYVETDHEHLFIYNDGQLMLTKVPINMNISVKDFEIMNDFVYFCGERSGTGLFGYFNVNDFFNVNQYYNITGFPMGTTTSTVATLNKLVVYTSNGNTELVAVGKTAGALECVAELQLYGTTGTYRVGELPTAASLTEDILSIVQTDDYVVTGGYFHYYSLFPTFRVFDKTDLFATSGLQNTAVTSICGNYTSCDFDGSQMLMEPAQGNQFLFATYWKEFYSFHYMPNPDPDFKGTYIGLYEVDPSVLPTGTAVEWVDGYRILHDYYNGGWKLRDMTQLNHSNRFYLLQEAELPGISQIVSMVLEVPVPGSLIAPGTTMVPAFYRSDNQYMSIGGYNNNQEYVMNGRMYSNMAKLLFCEKFTSQYNNCLLHVTWKTMGMFMSEKDNPLAFSVTSYTTMSIIHETGGTVLNVSTNNDCQ